MWGETGIGRLFNGEIGGQIAWLLPAALILLVAGLWFTARGPRAPTGSAPALIALGRLAPRHRADVQLHGRHLPRLLHGRAGAGRSRALVGIGAWLAVAAPRLAGRPGSSPAVAVALHDASLALLPARPHADFLPWLRWLVLVVGLVGALRAGRAVAGCLAASRRRSPRSRSSPALAGPAAYAVETAATAAHRLDPDAPVRRSHRRVRRTRRRHRCGGSRPAGWAGPGPTGDGTTGGRPGGGGGARRPARRQPAAAPSSPRCCRQTPTTYTWVAAAVGSNTAAGYQLASEEPVMAIGGFNGSDPSPDARAVPGVRRGRRDPLLHRWRRLGGRRESDGRQRRPAARSPPGSRRASPPRRSTGHGLRPERRSS